MMLSKKLIGTALIALFASTAAVASNDRVKVEHNGETYTFDRLDLEVLSVCGFKNQVAASLGLNIRRFDLRRSGAKLDERKTMKAAGVYNSRTIAVVPTSGSSQCT